MRVIRGLNNIRSEDRVLAVTLGNFDGVHRGHQRLLEQLHAAAPNLRRCVVCFEPQPLEFLRPDLAPVRLQSLAEKLRCLRQLQVDQVLVLGFDQRLAAMQARDFVRQVLVEGLGVRHLVVGDDYRFGHRRQGDVALLRAMATECGYVLDNLDTVAHARERVSSTRVRQALGAGDLDQAKACLGREYSLRGRVVHGQKLGRELGAPTANIALRRASPLRHGVYCVRLNGLPAVANIGLRPTIGGTQEHLEVHLLDGQHELYGKMVVVSFEQYLRGEHKFASLAELKAAIAADVVRARGHFEQDQA